ncbi:peptidase M24, structural domain-containing protein [Chytridium lagenaria]|nr:peptidase M24, structural domain-containing protein [Chytridium lagenaria]
MTASDATPVSTSSRLNALRQEMAARNIAAYIIPSEDAHQSEYIADCDGRRGFISGFTGSAGLAVVTTESAALWTDGRYFLQASQQLDSNWVLQKSGMPEVPTKEEWLVQVLPPSSNVGLDPTLITVTAARALADALNPAGHTLVPIADNLIDLVWNQTRPSRPKGKIIDLNVRYAGKSREDKLKDIQEQIVKKKGVWGLVLTALDEIAWIFNLRGSDIAYNPVFFAYALITPTSALLYVDDSKLDDTLKQSLTAAGITLKPYESFFDELKNLSVAQSGAKDGKVQKLWIDGRCSFALQESAGGAKFVEESRSPVQTAKSIKNASEIQGFRDSHIRDAVALCEYFAWLEDELVNKNNANISEVDAADKLESLRAKLDDFVGLSFDTISSTGSNGSIIHYKPTPGACKNIDPNAVYLCDSGAQYKDGTTDVTRTMHFKTPTAFEKEAYTRVLKGHIQIDMAIFPRGTTGYILDVLSRTSLWKGGLDFRHGTGHGVGHFLNVHEGPQGIGTRIGYNDIPLEVGMTVTNEPGYYEDGKFGIRIENVMIVKEVTTKSNFGGRGYLGFEHVTVVPIQTKMVDVELLLPEEKAWLNDYNAECFKKVSPFLAKDSAAYKWIVKETQPI